MSQNYENLKVWQESIELAEKVYTITKNFPKSELFGITSQIRRSVVSISSNIAEGSGRRSKKEFTHFIDIANGSLSETENWLILAIRFNYIEQKDYDFLRDKIKNLGNLLGGLRKYLNK